MRRDQLEHLIRAAGAISDSRHVIVIGSQAILGQFPDGAPARALLSMEADLLPVDQPGRADLITGAIGELSAFHDTFGYYAEGVSDETAILPSGWRDRLIAIERANTNGVRGLCLEIHDLLIAKYAAGREKDREYCSAIADAGLAGGKLLLVRLADTDVPGAVRHRMSIQIQSDFQLKG